MEYDGPLYNPFDAMCFTYDRCFLCGCVLGKRRSVEHVFPKWIQNKYNLWNKKIYLLNRSTITYRRLTIPCCRHCNVNCLSPIENTVKNHYLGGYSEFSKLDKITIYQWVAKIFYGLLFKELSLLMDRSDASSGFITPPELLEQLHMLHALLQSIRFPFEFAQSQPWSIFVLETHCYGDERDFDYHDQLETLTFSIRLSGIGIIACLEDNGAQEQMSSDYFAKFKGAKLHPIQFDELFAKVAYQASLLNRTPKYIVVLPTERQQKVTVLASPLQGFSSKPIFDEWNQRDYARVLAFYWMKYGVLFDDIFKEPNLVLSLIEGEDGAIKVLDANGNIQEMGSGSAS